MAGRVFTSGRYRYGFNGQEHDDEWNGKGNALAFKYRIHDPRIGRFLSVDPLAPEYPWYTPFQFAGNTPIRAAELEGLEPEPREHPKEKVELGFKYAGHIPNPDRSEEAGQQPRMLHRGAKTSGKKETGLIGAPAPSTAPGRAPGEGAIPGPGTPNSPSVGNSSAPSIFPILGRIGGTIGGVMIPTFTSDNDVIRPEGEFPLPATDRERPPYRKRYKPIPIALGDTDLLLSFSTKVRAIPWTSWPKYQFRPTWLEPYNLYDLKQNRDEVFDLVFDYMLEDSRFIFHFNLSTVSGREVTKLSASLNRTSVLSYEFRRLQELENISPNRVNWYRMPTIISPVTRGTPRLK